MILLLAAGRPYPVAHDLTDEESDHISENPSSLELHGVVLLEWKFELTVEFRDFAAFELAKALTGWPVYDGSYKILSATYDTDEGYEAPAIIAGRHAYGSFVLIEETK